MTIELLHADCMNYMAGLDDNSVDAIITDPPYFRVKGEAWDNQWESPAKFIEWVGVLCDQFQRILKPNGSLYFFASPQMAARVEVKIAERFNVLSAITWRKGSANKSSVGWSQKTEKEALRAWFPETERVIFAEQMGDQYADAEKAIHKEVYAPLGRYIQLERERSGLTRNDVEVALGYVSASDPTRGTALCYRWEEGSSLPTKEAYEKLRAVLNTSGGDYLRREYDYLRREYDYLRREYDYLRREYEDLRREYEDLRRPFNVTAKDQWSDVWEFDPVAAYPGKHPCEKPQPLLAHILNASTKPGAIVFDPFAGSGSMGIACQTLGRNFIGTELCPDNYAKAKRRLDAYKAQQTLFQPDDYDRVTRDEFQGALL